MDIENVILKKEYEIIKKISTNEHFVIYTIKDRDNNEFILKTTFNNDNFGIESLKNEVLALSRLAKYSFIAKVIDYTFDLNYNYIILEKIKGYDLYEYKEADLISKIIILLNLTQAVKQINDKNIVHCDLKLDNILVDINGRIKIIDFGIAQIDGNTKFKKYGTYNYCSLEKLSGKDIDFHEDMYAIGIILYELLGGVLSKEDKGRVLLINYDNKVIENTLNFIIRKCTANKVELRYNNFDELYRDLFDLYNSIK